ncbi:MAG: hypothetical protein U0166_11355 [Acidobacteriota bacterium]
MREQRQLKARDVGRRRGEKYRAIFENAIQGIFQTTLDGRYLSANPRWPVCSATPAPRR